MKAKNLRFAAIFGVTVLAAPSLLGLPTAATISPQAASYKKALATATPIELPAKAASAIAKAADIEREALTVPVVEAAVSLAPTAAPAIVGAIAAQVPSVASIAAVTAARLQPKQLALIAKAASAGAPSEAGKIVAALIREFPNKYPLIAIAASESVPGAGREILTVVANFVPSLQAPIQKTVGSTRVGTSIQVGPVLQLATAQIQYSARQGFAARTLAPTVGPRYTMGLPLNPIQININDNYPVLFGGRDYSAP